MSTPRTYLWADSLNNRLVYGWRGLVSAQPPRFRRGDKIPVTVRWVSVPTVAGGEMSEVELPLGESYALYVGRRAERPFGGQFYVSYGGQDSDLIDFDASASELERALNKIAAVSNTGGVTVRQYNGDLFKITFSQKGARTSFSANGDSLFPLSEGSFAVIQEGSASEYHVVSFKLRQLPIGQCLSFSPEPACTAAVEMVKADIWDVYLTSDAKDGYFTLSIDGGAAVKVSVFEDPLDLQESLGDDFTVIKAGDFRWRIQSNDGSGFLLSVVSYTDIVSFSGVQGNLVMTEQESDEFLSGKAYGAAILEIVRLNEDDSQFVVQTECVALNKIYT